MLLACTNEKGEVNVCLFESNDYGMTRVRRRISDDSTGGPTNYVRIARAQRTIHRTDCQDVMGYELSYTTDVANSASMLSYLRAVAWFALFVLALIGDASRASPSVMDLRRPARVQIERADIASFHSPPRIPIVPSILSLSPPHRRRTLDSTTVNSAQHTPDPTHTIGGACARVSHIHLLSSPLSASLPSSFDPPPPPMLSLRIVSERSPCARLSRRSTRAGPTSNAASPSASASPLSSLRHLLATYLHARVCSARRHRSRHARVRRPPMRCARAAS
jgi:hypothetical protein